MALFEMALKAGNELFCAHVNYHRRESAGRDEKIVKDYCKAHGVPFRKLDVYEAEGNFQDDARKKRYSFFADLVKEEVLDGVLVAHHLDDHLETYLLQKEHGGLYDHFGLSARTLIMGVPVIRPLLRKEKKELVKYCEDNHIPYGIDESNLADDYRRNVLRHTIIEKMTKEEKKNLCKTIREENARREEEVRKAKQFIGRRTSFPEKEFLQREDLTEILRQLLYKDLSRKYLEELERQLKTSKKVSVPVRDKYLIREYGTVSVFERPEEYSYTFDAIVCGNYKHFSLRKRGKTIEAVTLKEEDFPVTVRNAKEGDEISLRYGTKKVSRFFIDRKIPLEKRMSWPVMVNKDGTVVFVSGIGCARTHHSIHGNCFMII